MNPGLTTYSVQYTICVDGVYGYREWTVEEREAACKEFERMTGVAIAPRDDTPDIPLVAGSVTIGFVAGVVLGYILFTLLRRRKKNKIKR